MAGKIRQADFFSVTIDSKAGEGYRILSALKRGGVNLVAFSGCPKEGGKAEIDLVPEDPDAFLEAIINLDLDLKLSDRKKTFLIHGEDRVGVVADYLSRLAEKEINIIAIHALAADPGRFAMILWVNQEDHPRACDALGL
jgi:hypothetical protein